MGTTAPLTPILLLHILGGTFALLTGYVAVSVAKGERLHRIFGTVFFAAMLIMSSMAIWLAIPLQQWSNVIAGVVTFYLVSTAWLTVRRKENTTGTAEIAAMFVAFAGAATILYFGLQAMNSPKPPPGGAPVAAYFFMAGVAGLAGALDLKVILQGGISGTPRIARHLWRMCMALFAASGSFYTQIILRKVHMPAFLHHSPLLYIPIFAPLLLVPFWLIRVRFAGRFRRLPAAA